LKKFITFFKEYKQFGFVVITVIIGGILTFLGQIDAAYIVLASSALLITVPLVLGMIQDIRSGTYGVDILAVTAILSAILFKEYWAAIIIVFMLTGGEALEDYAERRAQAELTALLERAPQKAHVIRGRKEIDIPVGEVIVGDKIIIKPGEVVPVDAVVLEGISDFDESSLTGESLPVSKTIGQDLLSGSVSIDGSITAKALQTVENSQFSQIIKLVKAAQAGKSPFVRMADRYAVPFTLMAFTIAFGAWALSGDSLRFLQVLVVATPCPLILGAPIALISGMSRAAKHGIIIKNGSALEQLARVKTMGFDKTGTLTQGVPEVKNVAVYNAFKEAEVLKLAATLEQVSNHVLASAIVNYARSKKISLSKPKHVKEIAGRGLSSVIAGKRVLVGRLSLLEEENIAMPKGFNAQKINTTAAYIAIDGKLAGIISFEDALRKDASSTLERLKRLGIQERLMVTGDNKTTAQAIAKKLGIETVVSDALPADKLIAIDKAQYKPIGFVGDGVNDAPVLTAADVGIALGARGSTAASESADVVIMLDSLEQVAVGVDVSQRTIRIAKQSIMTGIALSTILMFIFATGKFPPIYGAAIQELVDVVVIIYALRAHGPWRGVKDDVIAS